MKQRQQNLGDPRKISSCLYCNYQGNEFTREHSPSKVFLDEPLPENLPITYSCQECNASFSQDEEYLACIIECARCGTTNIDEIERPKVKKALLKNKKLHRLIIESLDNEDGKVLLDNKKLYNIGMKLARGHLTFEMNEIALAPPSAFGFSTFNDMTEEEKDNFEAFVEVDLIYEISRVSVEMMVIEYKLQNLNDNKEMNIRKIVYPWQTVQEGIYRYMCAYNSGCLILRIVISEYLLFEVVWDNNKIKNLKEIE